MAEPTDAEGDSGAVAPSVTFDSTNHHRTVGELHEEGIIADHPTAPQRDGYYESTYQPGTGERDRVAKLIDDGVVVDGEEIKLAAFTRESQCLSSTQLITNSGMSC